MFRKYLITFCEPLRKKPNEVTCLIKASSKKYYERKFNQSGSDQKENSAVINEVMGKHRGSKVVDDFKSGDSLIYDNKVIADYLNTYFSTLV